MPHNEIPDLDAKGLRQFGLILAGVLVFIPGVLLPWIKGWQMLPNYYWVIAGLAVLIWALLAPVSIRGFYRRWMRVAMLVGHVLNIVVLALVFFLVITPMGLVMRMLGKDPMQRRLQKDLPSYRVESRVRDRNHFERPF